MRLLFIHCDTLRYRTEQPTKFAEEVAPADREWSGDEVLAVFTAVEKRDEPSPEAVVAAAVKEVADVAGMVKARRVLVYPYAHLSQSLAAPAAARDIVIRLAGAVAAAGFEVKRAPFGWYKSFTVSCKGHPLSELSREVAAGDGAGPGPAVSAPAESESLKREAETKRRFLVLSPDGALADAAAFDFREHAALGRLIGYETKKERTHAREPFHIRIMKEQELADHEPGSDSGNLRWYPKGRLIKKLLERHISSICIRYGAMEVETPVMYDFAHPALKKYMNRFPSRQYVIKSDEKEYFLRFAACFGQFLMAHDMNISYRSLPLKLFELTRYSFRREKSGEVVGLKRLRSFTMPDMHTICGGLDAAKEEFARQYALCLEFMKEMDLPYEAVFRVQADFFEANRQWYADMVRRIGRPVLFEVFDVRYAYFITKFEFNYLDVEGKAAALSTVQIDVENCETYDLTFVGPDGNRARPVILHASVSGAVERVVYALLEEQGAAIEKGGKARYPLWLAPVQVRFIPVNAEFTNDCEAVANRLSRVARCDVDDREEKVGRKIRDAELEWVPLIVVYGAKERASGRFPVRLRDGTQKEMSHDDLHNLIVGQVSRYPMEDLPLPRMLSKRPVVRG